ncbi:RraA family protein, partial [Ammoniphilus sp. 3BR4]
GVIVVPREKIEEAIEKAEKKLGYEQQRMDAIADFREKRKQGVASGTIQPSWLREKMASFGL